MLTRGLRLLDQLSTYSNGEGVSRIAEDAGLPISTAHRLLSVLAREGFVTFDSRARRYAVGLRVLALARNVTQTRSAYRIAREPMERVADQTNLPVLAAVLDGEFALLVVSVEGQQHIQVRNEVGTRNHWYCSSVGKVLVAFADPAVQERLLGRPLEPVTDLTITDPAVLRDQLESVRRRGWAEVYGENEVGVHAISVPVRRPGSDSVYCSLSIPATTVLTSRQQLHSYIQPLQETAEEIALRLAGANADFTLAR